MKRLRAGYAALVLAAWIAAAVKGAFAADASQQNPSRQFQQYLADLELRPQDRELREKIILLARTMQPAPEAPGDVDELEGRAAAALKEAKSPSDYLEAERAYQRALLLAPWMADDYLNLAAAQEKAGKHGDAASSLRFYLLAKPDAKDAKEVRRRIGALMYQAERAQAPEVGAGPKPAGDADVQVLDPQTAEMLKRFKALASGKYDATYECGRYTPVQALGKRERMECAQEELASGRWHKFEMLATHEFRFPDDGSIRLVSLRRFGKTLELLGRPKGPAFQDIEWRRCDKRGECAKRIWVRLSDDLSAITYSLERPPDDSSFDPNARYPYTQYRRK